VDIQSPEIRTVEARPGAAERFYARVTGRFYGNFGLGIDPASGRLVGFLFLRNAP
jgi:hypothetical protein